MSTVRETVTQLQELLHRVGGTDLPAMQAVLPAHLVELHRAVLRRFLEDGKPPSETWLHETAARLGLDPHDAAAQLAESDLVHLADGEVAVAYPFSGTPTRHKVKLDGHPEVYAVCAVDALGLPAMVGGDGVIVSTDPHTGEQIQVTCRNGVWTWQPESAVLLVAGQSRCAMAVENTCRTIDLYAHASHARAFLRNHPELAGEILDQPTAVMAGALDFGPLLGTAGSHA